jgi:hypothetical protein
MTAREPPAPLAETDLVCLQHWQPGNDARALAALQYHWGAAYVVSVLHGVWFAQRTDTGRVLRATDPESLLTAIRGDYDSNPVPRTEPVEEDEVDQFTL